MKYINKFNESKNSEKYLPVLKIFSDLLYMLDDKELNLDENCNAFIIVYNCLSKFENLNRVANELSELFGRRIDISEYKNLRSLHPSDIRFDPKKLNDEIVDIKDALDEAIYMKDSLSHKEKMMLLYNFNVHETALCDLIISHHKLKDISAFKFTSLDIEDFLLDYIDNGIIKDFDCYSFYEFDKLIVKYFDIGIKYSDLSHYNELEDNGKITNYYQLSFKIIDRGSYSTNTKAYNDILKRLEYNFNVINQHTIHHNLADLYAITFILTDK